MWDIYCPCSCHCCSVAKSSVTLLPLWTAACRILWPSLSCRICSDSCPLSQWCYLTISSSAVPFSSCPQSFPASGSFPVNWPFASAGQSIGASASASVLSVNMRVDFLEDWPVWSPCSPGDSKESCTAPQFKSINSSALMDLGKQMILNLLICGFHVPLLCLILRGSANGQCHRCYLP